MGFHLHGNGRLEFIQKQVNQANRPIEVSMFRHFID
jgi:hypothetical protein